jgi:DNA-binding MarR family transcriptional regulator
MIDNDGGGFTGPGGANTTLDATEYEAAVAAVRALARASRILERSTDELNLARYRVLAAVAGGDELASRVAARLALGRPAVSSAVAALTQRGLLNRIGVTGDQRAAVLSLTPAGRGVLARSEQAMTARITDLAARTPDAARLLEALGWLNDAVDQVYAERRTAEAPMLERAPAPGRAPVPGRAPEPDTSSAGQP